MKNLLPIIESRFLPFVQKPMQYVGNEINIIRKDFATVDLHGVLCFPETYDIGMSHYGGQILYHIINSQPAWALSRCYHPIEDAYTIMQKNNIPLFSLEYATPIKDADWIGFSVNYELQFTNIISMLSLAGLPPLSKDRDETMPIIIAGGSAMGNPEPIADFIDAFVLGDGEEAIVAVCTVLARMKKKKATKTETLSELSLCQGVYIPSLYTTEQTERFLLPLVKNKPVAFAKVETLKNSYYPSKPLVPLISVVHHRLAIEVMRGCTRGCRFCAAGISYRPLRERNVSDLAKQMNDSLVATGWRDIGLLSLSTADYSGLTPLLKETERMTRDQHIKVSLPSTRIDALCEQDLDALQSITPFSSFTIAPEAGTQRLRNVINKGFTDDDILATVNTLLKRGVQTIKVYFMIGLPTETSDDIDGIISLVQSIAQAAQRKSHRVNINVSISPYSPKPHTPFQWEAMDTPQVLFEKSHTIKKSLQQNRNVKTSYRDPYMARLETIMARGDRRLSGAILWAWKNGSLFDGRDEHFNNALWEKAFAACNIDMQTYLSIIPVEQELPWSIVTTGVTNDFLKSERNLALSETATPDCRNGECSDCGVCTTTLSTKIQEPKINTQQETPKPVVITHSLTEKHCFRCVYEKREQLRFLGHLDTVNVFLRAFLAAHIPLSYSQGFRSHPHVSFGPPLSLSIATKSDLFDITCTQSIGNDDISRINQYLPQGLKIMGITRIPLSHVSLHEDIRAGQYSFELIDGVENAAISSAIVNQQISWFMNQKEVIIDIEKDGRIKHKNIRELVHSCSLLPDAIQPSFEALLSMEPNNTCKPSQLVQALFPQTHASAWLINREKCLRKAAKGFSALY